MIFCIYSSLHGLVIKILNYGINLYMDFQIFYLFGVQLTETYNQHISLTELKKLNCLLKLIIHVDTELFLLSIVYI